MAFSLLDPLVPSSTNVVTSHNKTLLDCSYTRQQGCSHLGISLDHTLRVSRPQATIKTTPGDTAKDQNQAKQPENRQHGDAARNKIFLQPIWHFGNTQQASGHRHQKLAPLRKLASLTPNLTLPPPKDPKQWLGSAKEARGGHFAPTKNLATDGTSSKITPNYTV